MIGQNWISLFHKLYIWKKPYKTNTKYVLISNQLISHMARIPSYHENLAYGHLCVISVFVCAFLTNAVDCSPSKRSNSNFILVKMSSVWHLRNNTVNQQPWLHLSLSLSLWLFLNSKLTYYYNSPHLPKAYPQCISHFFLPVCSSSPPFLCQLNRNGFWGLA